MSRFLKPSDVGVAGDEFSVKGTKYKMLHVTAADFSGTLAVGRVCYVSVNAAGDAEAAKPIPNADDQYCELAVFMGMPAGRALDAPGAPPAAATADGVYLFAIKGPAYALEDGTGAIAIGDTLEILKNTGNFVVNGASGSTEPDAAASAVAMEAHAVASTILKKVYLRGGVRKISNA